MAAVGRQSSNRLPTAFGRNASGSAAASACCAFQLVQCAGTTTAGASAASAATVERDDRAVAQVEAAERRVQSGRRR